MKRPLNRRQFLISGSAALASLAACGRSSGTEAPDYRPGLQTYCFHDLDFDSMLRQVQALGLKYLEVFEDHLPVESTDDEIASYRSRLDSAGIEAVSIYTHALSRGTEPRKVFDFARKMGFQFITAEHKQEVLPDVDPLIPEYGIGVTIHNHGPGTPYSQLQDVTAVLERFENVTTCVDIGHYARSGVDPAGAIRALGSRIVELHVKDIDEDHRNTVVGEGIIDLPAVFAALKEVQFDGLLALEYEADWEPVDVRMQGMRKSLETIRRLGQG